MSPAAPLVRHALPHERIAIRAANWPGLPSWAWSAGTLRVAVAGRRELLLGCGWELDAGGAIEAGIALSPASHRAQFAADALLASFQPDSSRIIYWSEWLNLDDSRAEALRHLGFVEDKQMIAYRIPNIDFGQTRLANGFISGSARLAAAGFTWGDLDGQAVAEVRLACLREKLMSSREFDFQYQAGGFDPSLSPVVWQGGEVAGFAAVMKGNLFEVALLYVQNRLRRAGLNNLLLAEVVRRKTAADPTWREIIFRGNPEANQRTRRMCQRFHGSEDIACVKLSLHPVSSPE